MDENKTFRSVSAGSNGNAAVKRTEAPPPQKSPKVIEIEEKDVSENLDSMPPSKDILTQKETSATRE